MEIDKFLLNCAKSAENAYKEFELLLKKLDHRNTRQSARIFLGQLRQKKTDHFHFSPVKLGDDLSKYFLQLPSTFSPEEWSFTFYEGLARYSQSEFLDKNICELGCGNGWITLTLALRTHPKLIYGLDINPRAIVCAKLNLYLHALNDQGKEINNLLNSVKFLASDMFNVLRGKGIFFNRIIGCIPQVLNPDLDISKKLNAQTTSDTFLHSLSNYCEKQGYVEDQFGLGLISRALVESLNYMYPSGKIILNLGGRPGVKVIERLFTRRGFQIKKIWQRKIKQASDTAISSLVEIEKKTQHRFEFFMSHGSDESISAQTAQSYADKSGELYHTLTVYEAGLPQFEELKSIMQLLATDGYKGAHDALDFSYPDSRDTTEKITFVAKLINNFNQLTTFPYGETAGLISFREQIAKFLNCYYKVPLTLANILTAPNRQNLIANIFQIIKPQLSLVDSSPPTPNYGEILEIPQNVYLKIDLIKVLKPQLIITSLTKEENQNPAAFVSLMEAATTVKAHLVIDISDSFDLSSMGTILGVFQYMSENSLPTNVSIICDLVNNRVYQDLNVAFLISQTTDLLKSLINAAEFTYSRTPFLAQLYYETILVDLLKFQIGPQTTVPGHSAVKVKAKESKYILEEFDKKVIRFDFGENELDTPRTLRKTLLENFVCQSITDFLPEQEIRQLLKKRFKLTASFKLSYDFGVAPLFCHIINKAKDDNATILIPQGVYGYFLGALDFFAVPYQYINTDIKNSFKITTANLEKIIIKIKNPWIFLNAPINNPTGLYYNSNEVDEIINTAKKYSATLIIDTVFAGIEFIKNYQQNSWQNLKNISFILLGGISKEFAAAGLRFGYAASNIDLAHTTPQIHSVIYATVKDLYAKLNHADKDLMDNLNQQRDVLQKRAIKLEKLLTKYGWEVIPPQGGLFLIARPRKFEGKKIRIKDKKIALNATNLPKIIFAKTNLLINNDKWIAIPNYCRFVLSVKEEFFLQGIAALEKFHDTSRSI